MSDVLARIVEHKRTEIAEAKRRVPVTDLLEQLPASPPVRDFIGSIRARGPIGLIAEVKKASPSAGLIRDDFDPVKIASVYAGSGAACISVLTDEKFFQGHLEFLRQIRAAVSIPLLRKDFILDRYQILEGRIAGADAVLLIAECLSDDELTDLYAYTRELGMEALIELYEPENLERVLKVEPRLVGVNNRDLRSFKTDLGHSATIRAQVPRSVCFVSESGIETRQHVESLIASDVDAILVGETLMRSADIGGKVRELLGLSTPQSV
ncbi:indole-3-glycerol phosphate synthase TrpC [Planctomyces sp. SH-PL14]|uniref:indole-3-glycerol phosphate synthase TrpC n=1 Tax=Planctomyces sp. SH-PL14 TaxID=1632864 RepID=UPI00078CCC08|nr:indole-3-glycerol phosphate synthase TrpC [Planctomyces sp. SH-PL14]AMV18476.1 Indole-3-glycerol phosphate synthase [Planctomyces sp. SH-PL14]